jgi:hypothetical protein
LSPLQLKSVESVFAESWAELLNGDQLAQFRLMWLAEHNLAVAGVFITTLKTTELQVRDFITSNRNLFSASKMNLRVIDLKLQHILCLDNSGGKGKGQVWVSGFESYRVARKNYRVRQQIEILICQHLTRRWNPLLLTCA